MTQVGQPWRRLGTVVFWLTWPGLWLTLQKSTRTRLLIVVGDEALVTRTWLSDGRWSLPGGGLHKAEDAVDGVLRELREETSIQLDAAALRRLTTGRYRSHGLRFQAIYFTVTLPTQPRVRLRRFEMSGYQWVRLGQMTPKEYAPDVLTAVNCLRPGAGC